MKHPMWIINSILLCILVIMGSYIAITARKGVEKPKVKPVFPLNQRVQEEEKPRPKDVRYLYEKNDLFGTYAPVMDVEKPAPLAVPSAPEPPAPIPLFKRPERTVEFLEPLPLKVSSIIAHSIESKSQATLRNTKTKESHSYKVGDKVFDAYVVRIFPNKVILIRSNGQQETLYRSQAEAQKEMALFSNTSWQNVIKQTAETSFDIFRQEFIDQVISLAYLIDALDATTAVIRGEPIGCRIGKIDPNSIGYHLGLRPGDIITKIAGIEPTSTTRKLEIYDLLTHLEHGQTFVAHVLRNKRLHELNFTIRTDQYSAEPKRGNSDEQTAPVELNQRKQQKKIRSLSPRTMANQQRKLQPHLQQNKTRDRKLMDHYGSYDSAMRSSNR